VQTITKKTTTTNRHKEIAPPQRAVVTQLGLGFGVV
jgi:hypothetical protein